MTSTLQVLMSSFGVAKHGTADADWEDAAAHSERGRRFALADGAAVAYQAGLWSHLLVRGFMQDPFDLIEDEAFRAWIERRSREWAAQTALDPDAPYYLRHAQQRGSHATFLGVELEAMERFAALAVGDTCLFHVRDGQVIRAFPVLSADDFGFHPELIATNGSGRPLVQRCEGEVRPGDMLLGATDAFAEWLLRELAAGNPGPIQEVRRVRTSIDELVATARSTGRLRNDDIAVVRCLIDAKEGP